MNDSTAHSNPTSDDPDALLRQLDLQIALKRAKRLSGQDGDRRTARTVGLLFILLIIMGALGALLYLKTTRYPEVIRPKAVPAPAASGRLAR